MLSDLEVGQFHAFGFVVLRQCLAPDEVERLRRAHERVMAEAPVYNYFGENETRMIAPFVETDDAFGELIEHPRIMEAMRDAWGRECLYFGGSDMWLNRDDTPWHSDGRPGRAAITHKVAIYLDPQDGEQGALNVLPGSHHPEFCAAIFQNCGYWDRGRPRLRLDRDSIPGATPIRTEPGDVVLWDNRIWHSAWRRKDGQPRRTMFISYIPDPGDDLLKIDELRAAVRASLNERKPYIYSRALLAKGGPARAAIARRLEELGVERVREPGV